VSSEGKMTAVTSKGVLTFDGEVVESFGYSFDRPIRAHVAMLRRIEYDRGGRFSDPSVTFKVEGQPIGPHAVFTEEEAASPEVTELIDAVRAAAPNLEEGAAG
jgi:hypothetical protein